MPVTKMGLNITAIQNLTVPDLGLNKTTAELMADIPIKANEVTNGFYGLGVLIFVFGFLYWKFTEVGTEFADFQYSNLRGISIASGICGIVGIFLLNIGYFVDFYHVAIFLTIFAISFIWVWKEESN